jgi:hypothetical protein
MIGKTQEQKKVVFSVQGKEVAHVPMRIAENVFGYVKDWLADEKSEEDLVIKVDEFGPEAAQLLSEFIAMALVYTRYREGLKLSPVFQRLIAQYPTLDEYINTKIKKSPHLASLYYLTDFLNMQGSLADHLNTLVPYIIARDKTLFNDPNGFRLAKNKQTLPEEKLKALQKDINVHRIFSKPFDFMEDWPDSIHPNTRVRSIALDGKGLYGIITSMGALRIFNMSNPQIFKTVQLVHNAPVDKLVLNQRYVLVTQGSTMIILEIPSGQTVATLSYPTSIIQSIALGDNEKHAMIGLINGDVKIIEIPSCKELTTLQAQSYYPELAIAKDSSNGVIAGNKFVKIIDVSTGEELITVPQDSSVFAVEISDDGKYVMAGSSEGTTIINVLSKKIEFIPYSKPHSKPQLPAMALSRNGNYVLRGEITGLEIIDVLRSEIVSKNNEPALDVAINKKGTLGVTLNQEFLSIFELPSGKALSSLPRNFSSRVAIDEEGNLVLSNSMIVRIGLKDFTPEQAMAIAVVDALYNNGMLSQLEPSSYIYKQLKTLPGEAKDKLKEYYNLPLETIISRILRWFRR